MKHLTRLGLFCICLLAAIASADGFKLGMDESTDVFVLGEQLMSFDMGLHRLAEQSDSTIDKIDKIVIGVHGWESKGYEWVYPLNELSGPDVATYFFRWDYSKCPIDSGRVLIGHVKKAVSEIGKSIESITLVGHSLGGTLVTSIASEWDVNVSTEFHVVASPLAWIGRGNCDQMLPEKLPLGVTFYQWRTQHQLDNAFKNVPVDPQVVEIPGSPVVTLPDTYKGNRLGHNWSVSYIADRLRDARNPDDT